MTMQREKVERAVTDGMKRAYDANAVNVESPRRDSGGQTMEYARDLAQRAQALAEHAHQKLAPISILPVEQRECVAEEPPQPAYFRELYEHLAAVTTALDSIEGALAAVDV